MLHDGEEPIDLAEMEPAPLAEREPAASPRRGAETVAHLIVSMQNRCADAMLLKPCISVL